MNLAAWYRDRAGSGSPTDGPGSVALVISSTPAGPAASGTATVSQPAAAGQLAVATVSQEGGPPPDPVPVADGGTYLCEERSDGPASVRLSRRRWRNTGTRPWRTSTRTCWRARRGPSSPGSHLG